MQEGSGGGSGDAEAEPMSMQQRVIQSGLDSIKGKDAPSIVQLFKAMAVFAVCRFAYVLVLPRFCISVRCVACECVFAWLMYAHLGFCCLCPQEDQVVPVVV